MAGLCHQKKHLIGVRKRSYFGLKHTVSLLQTCLESIVTGVKIPIKIGVTPLPNFDFGGAFQAFNIPSYTQFMSKNTWFGCHKDGSQRLLKTLHLGWLKSHATVGINTGQGGVYFYQANGVTCSLRSSFHFSHICQKLWSLTVCFRSWDMLNRCIYVCVWCCYFVARKRPKIAKITYLNTWLPKCTIWRIFPKCWPETYKFKMSLFCQKHTTPTFCSGRSRKKREANIVLCTRPRTSVLEEGAVCSRGERRGKGVRCQHLLLIRTRGGGRGGRQRRMEEEEEPES